MMSLPNFLQKLAPVGVAAIGAIALTGIGTAPAQAVGTLGFSGSASDFYMDVEPGAGDTFTVFFSPDSSKNPFDDGIGQTTVGTANGHFVPPFETAPPDYFADVLPVEANFAWVDWVSEDNGVFRYELQNDITFDFLNEDVQVTWKAGSLFDGEFNDDNGVGFVEVAGNPRPMVMGISSTDVIADDLVFQDIMPVGGAGYSASVSTHGVKVPEPASMLGILVFGGLGLAMKRKQEQK